METSVAKEIDPRTASSEVGGRAGNEAEDRAPVRRNTWQKEAVRSALTESSGFISAQALHEELFQGGQRIGLATVYRALGALVEQGEADTLQSDEGEALYRLCSMDEHHHHLICRQCGKTVEIQADAVEAWANDVAAEHGFSQPRHIVDVFGTCGECAERVTAAK